jgi:NAD(P)-dependent dehydrogenase (short-subunit alcohol dehydrogenase family)
LQDKRAVVFGGGGAIGAAVAQELAAEGAEVFVAGRSSASVELVAKQIAAAGGRAHADVVDALDEAAVDDYLDGVVRRAGGIDVELNAMGPSVAEYGHGKPALELPVAELMTAFDTVVRSQFVTARLAARRMVAQGSGVVVFLTATPARVPYPGSFGIGAAYGAVESMTRTMALEVGPAGVRAVCLRTHANPDTPSIRDSVEGRAERAGITVDQVLAGLAEGTMLKALPSTADTARAAAFLASDRSGFMTGTVLNFSAGAFPD